MKRFIVESVEKYLICPKKGGNMKKDYIEWQDINKLIEARKDSVTFYDHKKEESRELTWEEIWNEIMD